MKSVKLTFHLLFHRLCFFHLFRTFFLCGYTIFCPLFQFRKLILSSLLLLGYLSCRFIMLQGIGQMGENGLHIAVHLAMRLVGHHLFFQRIQVRLRLQQIVFKTVQHFHSRLKLLFAFSNLLCFKGVLFVE